MADYGVGEFQIRIKDRTNSANIRYISMPDMTSVAGMSEALKFVDFKDGYYTSCKNYGEHNKPNGSYTGNGSATSRTIATGGISRLLLIRYADTMVLVSPAGAVCKNGTSITALSRDVVSFDDGVLTMSTDNILVNQNSGVYYYYVL